MLNEELLLIQKERVLVVAWIPYDIVFKGSLYRQARMVEVNSGFSRLSTNQYYYFDFNNAPDDLTLKEVIEDQGLNPDNIKGSDGFIRFCIKFLVPVTFRSSEPVLHLEFDKDSALQYSNYSDAIWEIKGADTSHTMVHYDIYNNEEDIWVSWGTSYTTRVAYNFLNAPIKAWWQGDYLRTYLSSYNLNTLISSYEGDTSDAGWIYSTYSWLAGWDCPICLTGLETINGISVYNGNDNNINDYYSKRLYISDSTKYWWVYDGENSYINPDLPIVSNMGKSIYSLTEEELESVLLSPQTIEDCSGEYIQSLIDLPVMKIGIVVY